MHELPGLPGRRLGRWQEHDPASKSFHAVKATHLHDVMWKYNGHVLDQGEIGSCTGNSAVEVLMSGQYYDHLKQVFTEDDALAVYTAATKLDRLPGFYPVTDTGSSGIAVMKACKKNGWIVGYQHAFGLDHAMRSLMLGPVITGTTWTTGMFDPDSDNFVHPTGDPEGGHEYTVLGYDQKKDAVRCLNHWTPDWGDGGYFWMKREDWGTLLKDGGDVTIPVL